MTKDEYKQKLREITKEYFNSELEKAKEKGLTVTGAHVDIELFQHGFPGCTPKEILVGDIRCGLDVSL